MSISDAAGTPFFRVAIDGMTFQGFTKMQGLTVTNEHESIKAGGINSYTTVLPGRTSHDAVVLTRPVTGDPTQGTSAELSAWPSTITTRTTAEITLMRPNMVEVAQWSLNNVLPIAYSGPEGDTSTSAHATETITIAYEGFTDTGAQGSSSAQNNAAQNLATATLDIHEPPIAFGLGLGIKIATLQFQYNPEQIVVNGSA